MVVKSMSQQPAHRLDPIAHISGCNSGILAILTAGKSPRR